MPTTLLHSPADITAQILTDLGLVTDPSRETTWPVYVEGEPNLPDNVVTVYTTQGQDDGRSMTDGELQTHHGIQIRIRSMVHTDGWQKADAIRTGLAKSVNQRLTSLDSSEYLVHCFSSIGQILVLGKEVSPVSSRRLFTINALVSIDTAL